MKFTRSWQLFQASMAILRRHPRLLVFPVVTAVLTFVILLFFVAPLAFQPTGYRYTQSEHWQAVWQSVFVDQAPAVHADFGKNDATLPPSGSAPTGEVTIPGTPSPTVTIASTDDVSPAKSHGLKPLGMVYLAAAYLLSMLLATYFNVAFYHEILAALQGDEVSLGRGLAFALTRWQAILLWTCFAGLVGLIIRQLEEKVGIIGRIILSLLGTAWSVASIFVIPLLVTETEAVNPIGMLKKSAATLRRTWGESLIGYAGFQFGSLMVVLASLVGLGAAGAVCAALGNYWMLGIVGAFWLVALIAFSYVMNVASQVYRCALFIYSTQNTIPAPYNLELLQLAWKTKKVKE